MGLFGKLVKTAVNTAIIPFAVAADVVIAPVTIAKKIDRFMDGGGGGEDDTFTERAIQTLKDDADD